MVADPQKFYSSREYLALENSAEYKSEFFNGHIYAMAGATPNHVRLSGNVYHALRTHLTGNPCEVFNSDLRVQISETGAYVYPDVTVACPPLQFSEDDPNALTNPVVVIEVLSPSTEAHDRGAKWAHYQRLESLCDYVLVSQDQMRLEHYERQEDGSWRYSVAEKVEAFVTLESIGCRLNVSEVYERVEFISA
jgi:Uma2 family endonuclease